MTPAAMQRVLRVAAIGSLTSLGLLTWSFFDTDPLVMVVALTLGQGLGTASLVAFISIVIADLRRKQVLPLTGDDPRSQPPSRPPEPFDETEKDAEP